MNWLDVFILLFLVSAFIRGIEVGFVRQFCSATGFFVGFFAGAWIEGHLIGRLDSSDSRAVFALLVTLGFAVLLMLVGEYLGLRLIFKLSEGRVADRLDRLFGSGLAIVTLLAAVWLGASIFRNFPSDTWQRQIRTSRIVAALNESLPSAPALLTKLGHLIDPNGFPQVFTGLERSVDTDTPLPNIGKLTPAVQKTRVSVVKIEGEGCGGIVQGSGFVAGDDEVITNAHVVAGVDEPMVIDANGQHDGRVVWFDPELDLAVLRVRNLAGDPLVLRTAIASKGTATAIVGFPGGEGFRAVPAAVLEAFTAIGRDIYNHGRTERQVYSLKGTVEQGNSGGPVITADGSVIGVLFAKSASYEQVGYALTADQAASALAQAEQSNTPITAVACAE
jgi:S1-C subfamily serine protease